MWNSLRRKRLDGRKFRRQQPIGPFVVDFFCPAERLIVEVDGPIHASQREADRVRQQLLETVGLHVVRLSAEQVEQDLPAALAAIRQAFGSCEGVQMSLQAAPTDPSTLFRKRTSVLTNRLRNLRHPDHCIYRFPMP